MHALPTARPALMAAVPRPGRHRRTAGMPRSTVVSRPAQALRVAGRAGSLVSMSALALLGTAVAAGLSQPTPTPAAERPTVVVTYDVDH
jgi:hypothetical protein